MKKITIYGKGGIGKSVISSHLSTAYALMGYKVLQVGCDPKHDSTLRVRKNASAPIRTAVDLISEISKSSKDAWKDPKKVISYLVNPGKMGIDCIEAGGPEPGVGCGGRGIIFLFEMFEEIKFFEQQHYDIVIYDVLGDVVCGGFATPISKGIGEMVYIVLSEEIMALYAANNICKAILRYSKNNIQLGGFIANLRDNRMTDDALQPFANALHSSILSVFRRNPIIREAEAKKQTTLEYNPDSEVSQAFLALAEKIIQDTEPHPLPTVLDDDAFNKIIEEVVQSKLSDAE